ncbi:RNA polymerase sigma factor [Filimonas effusa]|uniref:RNA polymerase sigma factor n=1 Tax=Filimonas effusa TaxID=2508721 RepID=A0A4V1MAS5_9BACT|nr:RNA polymerase sigma factor [Filimonas effusa]RXK86896.1 RNA polymerase sigma factor [Filimonas effusa]
MQATLTIPELIEGCRANDRKAQELLYRQFYAFAMAIAMRYSRDEADAADIMSLAFVKLFKSIHSFNSEKGTLHAWIKKIVINEALDHIKARHRFISQEQLEAAAEEAQVDNNAIDKLNATEIMTMIQQLPPATHAVFVLYAIDGYNHREIAERLGISDGTSKWHLSEARKTLQKKLSGSHA